ncbi:MAG: hypothetical protein JRF17_00935 [Deltaproteobacteria bacterium]|jgi:hypothetical protein|nr:hypothetical protein [Deltaproteobacteria bacterium]
MENSEEKKSEIEKVRDDLFSFAIDREDIKWLMERLPQEANIQRSTVEYELQILKIISVGWSISYYLENNPQKNPLLELFWMAIYEFSQHLSTTTELMIGQDIDYFQILKERLDMYVEAMAKKPDAPEPSTVIGPEFARTCGNEDDIFTFMTGSKMFLSTTVQVKEYLDKINLK